MKYPNFVFLLNLLLLLLLFLSLSFPTKFCPDEFSELTSGQIFSENGSLIKGKFDHNTKDDTILAVKTSL